jgi:isopenicillin-N N-acyltransferase-like protein
MAFYKDFFMAQAKMEWDPVCEAASKWLPLLEKDYPHYVEEMQGRCI